MNKFKIFVSSELKELATRDADQLFSCIRDNLQELGYELTDDDDDHLYNEIETQLKGEQS